MAIEKFPITDRASWLARRQQDVTASTAAALFGCHNYVSPYGLYCLKAGLVSEDGEETPAMRRGRILEPVALDMLREERPDWTIEAGTHYFRDPDARIGATPDAHATRPDIEGHGIVQLKTVGHFAFKKGWRTPDGDVEIPLWIAIQAATEAALTGSTWAAVAALQLGDGGLEMHIEDIPLNPALMVKLRELVADFWRRVEAKEPYDPDFGKDGATIARVFSEDNGSEIDLAGDNRVAEIVALRERLKLREADGSAAARERKPLDAELLLKMANAARARLDGGRMIEAKTVRKAAFQVKASTYRNIKITGAAAE